MSHRSCSYGHSSGYGGANNSKLTERDRYYGIEESTSASSRDRDREFRAPDLPVRKRQYANELDRRNRYIPKPDDNRHQYGRLSDYDNHQGVGGGIRHRDNRDYGSYGYSQSSRGNRKYGTSRRCSPPRFQRHSPPSYYGDRERQYSPSRRRPSTPPVDLRQNTPYMSSSTVTSTKNKRRNAKAYPLSNGDINLFIPQPPFMEALENQSYIRDVRMSCMDGEYWTNKLLLVNAAPTLGCILNDQLPGEVATFIMMDYTVTEIQTLFEFASKGFTNLQKKHHRLSMVRLMYDFGWTDPKITLTDLDGKIIPFVELEVVPETATPTTFRAADPVPDVSIVDTTTSVPKTDARAAAPTTAATRIAKIPPPPPIISDLRSTIGKLSFVPQVQTISDEEKKSSEQEFITKESSSNSPNIDEIRKDLGSYVKKKGRSVDIGSSIADEVLSQEDGQILSDCSSEDEIEILSPLPTVSKVFDVIDLDSDPDKEEKVSEKRKTEEKDNDRYEKKTKYISNPAQSSCVSLVEVPPPSSHSSPQKISPISSRNYDIRDGWFILKSPNSKKKADHLPQPLAKSPLNTSHLNENPSLEQRLDLVVRDEDTGLPENRPFVKIPSCTENDRHESLHATAAPINMTDLVDRRKVNISKDVTNKEENKKTSNELTKQKVLTITETKVTETTPNKGNVGDDNSSIVDEYNRENLTNINEDHMQNNVTGTNTEDRSSDQDNFKDRSSLLVRDKLDESSYENLRFASAEEDVVTQSDSNKEGDLSSEKVSEKYEVSDQPDKTSLVEPVLLENQASGLAIAVQSNASDPESCKESDDAVPMADLQLLKASIPKRVDDSAGKPVEGEPAKKKRKIGLQDKNNVEGPEVSTTSGENLRAKYSDEFGTSDSGTSGCGASGSGRITLNRMKKL